MRKGKWEEEWEREDNRGKGDKREQRILAGRSDVITHLDLNTVHMFFFCEGSIILSLGSVVQIDDHFPIVRTTTRGNVWDKTNGVLSFEGRSNGESSTLSINFGENWVVRVVFAGNCYSNSKRPCVELILGFILWLNGDELNHVKIRNPRTTASFAFHRESCPPRWSSPANGSLTKSPAINVSLGTSIWNVRNSLTNTYVSASYFSFSHNDIDCLRHTNPQ